MIHVYRKPQAGGVPYDNKVCCHSHNYFYPFHNWYVQASPQRMMLWIIAEDL